MSFSITLCGPKLKAKVSFSITLCGPKLKAKVSFSITLCCNAITQLPRDTYFMHRDNDDGHL